MLGAVLKLQLEFFPGLDPANEVSGQLNINFTGQNVYLCLEVVFEPTEFSDAIVD